LFSTKICCWTKHQQPSTIIPPKKFFTGTIQGPWQPIGTSLGNVLSFTPFTHSESITRRVVKDILEGTERKALVGQTKTCLSFSFGYGDQSKHHGVSFFFGGGALTRKNGKSEKTVKAYAEYHRNLSMVKYTVPILTL